MDESDDVSASGRATEFQDWDLLIQCDSLLSLIRHREYSLSEQTIRDIDALLISLRQRSDHIIEQRQRRERKR